MSRLMYWALALATALTTLVSASGCGGEPSAEAYLYVAAPITGELAQAGQENAGGARLRAKEVNQQGGVLGKKVVVRVLDDGADEAMAVDAAKVVADAVRSGETVLGVVGHYNSGATSAALDAVYKDLDVVVVTPGSSNPTLTQRGYRRFFRVVSTDDIQGPVAARKALSLGWKRIAILRTDSLYGRGLAEAVAGELKRNGNTPVAEIEMKYNNLGVFLKELPDRVKQALSSQPDGIYFAGDYPEGIPLVEALREAGYKGGIMAGDSVMDYEFVDQLGSFSDGVIFSNILPEVSAVATPEWTNAYRVVEKRSPGINSPTGYAAAQVILEGVKRAGSAKGSAVADAMRKLEMDTIVGNWAADDTGEMRVRKVFLFQVQGGRFVQIGEER